jgi:hypothetical protein
MMRPGAIRRLLCRVLGAALAILLMGSLFYSLGVISADLTEWWRTTWTHPR